MPERTMINRRHFAIRTAGTLGALAMSPASALAGQLNATVALSSSLDRELTEQGDAAAPELMAEDEKFLGTGAWSVQLESECRKSRSRLDQPYNACRSR